MASCPGASPSLQDGLASSEGRRERGARRARCVGGARARRGCRAARILGAAPDPLSVDFLRLPEPVLPESGTPLRRRHGAP
ncbi:hypothetical protein ACU4GD_14810 [Cupriavidus basilensis]